MSQFLSVGILLALSSAGCADEQVVVAADTAITADADAKDGPAAADVVEVATSPTADTAEAGADSQLEVTADTSAPLDSAADTAQACQSAAQCGLQVCKAGVCAACAVAADCGSSAGCFAGKCLPDLACASDKQCQQLQLVCDKASGKCAECAAPNDCSDGGLCKFGVCVAVGPSCTSTKQCALGLVCHKVGQVCVQCTEAADCPASQTCASAVCVPKICQPKAAKCLSGTTLNTCDAAGANWTTSSCEPGHSCQGQNCQKWLCQPGQDFCQGAQVVSCASDGLMTSPLQDCEKEAKKCQAGKCVAPPACTAGSSQCVDNDAVKLCSADGSSWTTISCTKGTTCENGACKLQCQPGDDLGGATITDPKNAKVPAVAALADDSWLVAGQWSPVGGKTRGLLLRADSAGKPIWKKAFDVGFEGSELRAAASSGAVLVAAGHLGPSPQSDSAMWLVRTNAAGTSYEYNKFSDTSDSETVGWRANGVASDGAGGWYLGGLRYEVNTPQSEDAIVVRAGVDGGKLWSKKMGGLFGDLFHAVASQADGGVLAVGQTWAGTEAAAWLVRLDNTGKVTLELKPTWAANCSFLAVVKVGDGMAVSGTCGVADKAVGWYGAYDGSGTLLYKQNLSDSGWAAVNGLALLPDQGLVFNGANSGNSVPPSAKLLVGRASKLGQIVSQWQVTVVAPVGNLARRSDGVIALGTLGKAFGVYCAW
ncbi:MAG: hypothetical protein EXR77_05760 [Myxococcales bacterium]|nr:hypothetical protein [Myxococcales bacterium]